MEHQRGGEVGGVDGGLGGAGAGLGFLLGEQGGGVVGLGFFGGGGEDSDDFSEHSAVGPELGFLFDGSPDGGAGADRIHTAERCFANVVVRAVAVEDRENLDVGVDAFDMIGGGFDLGATEVVFEITLGGDVGQFYLVEVDELDLFGTDGGELDGNLATNRTDADDRNFELVQFVHGDEILLAGESVGWCVHGFS